VTDHEDNLKLFTPRIPGLQTTAQLVGRNAATRLLQASGVLDRPVDSFVQMHWITGQPVQAILPNGCSERKFEGAGSTVQKKSRGFFTKLVRDWKRGSYRAAVRRHPQT
jgi:GR25 family glycosyltransferase involved in LPS biosynthesis